MYKMLGKKYLHGVSDAGTRLLFKFRSGMHGLNDELEVEKANWTVLCVVLSVRTWCICLALYIVVVELVYSEA